MSAAQGGMDAVHEQRPRTLASLSAYCRASARQHCGQRISDGQLWYGEDKRGMNGTEMTTHLSTSSLSIMNSFFSTLMAYRLFVFFSSANITLPKLPLPSTARKLKSSRPTFLLRAGGCCCLGGCCCGGCIGDIDGCLSPGAIRGGAPTAGPIGEGSCFCGGAGPAYYP